MRQTRIQSRYWRRKIRLARMRRLVEVAFTLVMVAWIVQDVWP